ncbi:glycosyltransferase [Oceanirhabdus sp. W0125-5]|uniref:glycosyltransferase n=1 Tax=Oceanirhabdus sp. W0125-5 TaxID=2999116 RepID=UPI0022F326BB|nr:glycosyltransferase [Oceanirhabdus sp. W0125-5]WBW96623.1 glycosyltransferase [Oceanirhabdus sp. W0125-5]
MDKYKKIRLLFAGHDLKFAKMIIEYFKSKKNYEVRIDLWKGHNQHNESVSYKCIKWADVIVCEWGLGNTVWYSNHKRKNQVLIVRMHAQELRVNYPQKFNMKNINKIITVGPKICRDFKIKCKIPNEKLTVIYNLIDGDKLNINKTKDAGYNIGLLGYCPKMKGLDKAIDIFEKLWLKDKKYKLYIKGKHPSEYSWLWKRKDEREYYEGVFKRINQSKWKASVRFEPWSSDIFNWFTKIGFILSVSEFESFHLAIAEGMASGSIPIIYNWEGAEEIYPKKYIFKNTEEACLLIDKIRKVDGLNSLQKYVGKFARERFDKKIICIKWEEIIKKECDYIGK